MTALPLAAAALLGWAVDTPLRAVRQPGPAPVDQLVALGAAALCGTLLATFALGALLTALAAMVQRTAGTGGAGGATGWTCSPPGWPLGPFAAWQRWPSA